MFFGADRGSGTVQADSEPLLYLVPEAVRTFIRIFKKYEGTTPGSINS